MAIKLSGLGGRVSIMKDTNSAWFRGFNAGLKRRSNPTVETTFPLKSRPHVDPANAPG